MALKLSVTGMAWLTPLGDDLDRVWGRLLGGESGIAEDRIAARLRSYLVAAVAEPARELPAEDRLVQMAVATIGRAVRSAGVDPSAADTQLVLGTSLGAYLDDPNWRKSLYAWGERVNSTAGFSNSPIVLSTACSSGSDAILVGAELIRSGKARCCVCGGADVLTLSKRLAHSALSTMSPTMLRAFDQRHDGTVLGEGAACMVLEGGDSAQAPLAHLVGIGAANDAAGMTAPDATGLGGRYALERSLIDANLEPSAIGLINAHGSGTPLNDAIERVVFQDVFGGRGKPLVFATKGNFGHSLGATGAIEAVAVLLALRTHRVPPIFGLEQPDPEFPLPLACGAATTNDSRFGLSLTLGFGGFDTSLIFETAE